MVPNGSVRRWTDARRIKAGRGVGGLRQKTRGQLIRWKKKFQHHETFCDSCMALIAGFICFGENLLNLKDFFFLPIKKGYKNDLNNC